MPNNTQSQGDASSSATAPVRSAPAVMLIDLPAYCAATATRGRKVITYKCNGCGELRQLEVARSYGYRRQEVVCECGQQQTVHVF